MKKRIEHYEENVIRELLFGRRVKVISKTELELDNGIILDIQANEG